MDIILEFLKQYYGIVIVGVGAIIYGVTHQQIAILYVKRTIADFMFLAEKKAEELLLITGEQKKQWVLENGYDYLPKQVKVVVSKKMFEIMIQEVFDTAIEYVKKNKIDG